MHKSALAATTSSAIALASFCAGAWADYRGPHAGTTTVAQILKDPKDDTHVLLQGTILRKTAPERYVFSDGTGEIAIEIEDEEDVFPADPVDDKTRVEIAGEVDKDFRKAPEIDVDSMRIVLPGP